MSKPQSRARIAISIPPGDLEDADALAARLDRSRSWVIAEAVRRYVASEKASPVDALGASRRAQLAGDLRLTPEQRVLAAEETLRLSELVAPRPATGPRAFDSYEEFLDWKLRRNLAP